MALIIKSQARDQRHTQYSELMNSLKKKPERKNQCILYEHRGAILQTMIVHPNCTSY